MKTFDKTDNINIEDIDLAKNKETTEDSETNELKEFEEKMLEQSIEKTSITEEISENDALAEIKEEIAEGLNDLYESTEEKIQTPEETIETEEEIFKDFKPNEKEASLRDIVQNDFQEKTIIEMNVPNSRKIGIASDHRGYHLKQKLTNYLDKKGYTVVDYGCDSTESADYPEFGFKLGEAVANYEVDKGIAICGSGIGISIACNKIKGVRCAKVNNPKEAKYTRHDNDANIIALSAAMPTFRAKDIIDVYLKTPFSGLERHQRRIDMLNKRG